MTTRILLAIALTAPLVLTGCGSYSKADVKVTGTTTVSKGQELSDLQKALEQGAISQKDYDKVRAIILKR